MRNLEVNHGVCDDAGCQCGARVGGRPGGGRIIDVLESPEHAPRNICLRRHVVNIEIAKCFKYWVVKRHCRQLLSCDHRRCTKQAVRRGARWSRGVDNTSYRTAPPSESQRSCTAALCVRDCLSRRLIMSKPSTVESLSGAAAAIMVACARSGSVWGGTTSRTILLRLSPRTSTVFGGWSRYPSSRTSWPPVASLVGAFAQSLSLYSTRSMGPSRTESTASRSGSSVVRSSLCGHHAPSTYPVWGALAFSRNRGVCSGGVGCRPTPVRSCRGAMVTLLS